MGAPGRPRTGPRPPKEASGAPWTYPKRAQRRPKESPKRNPKEAEIMSRPPRSPQRFLASGRPERFPKRHDGAPGVPQRRRPEVKMIEHPQPVIFVLSFPSFRCRSLPLPSRLTRLQRVHQEPECHALGSSFSLAVAARKSNNRKREPPHTLQDRSHVY